MVVAGAEIGVGLEEAQRVMHPAHVPLVVEVEAALGCGLCRAGKVRRVLSHKEAPLVEVLDAGIHLADEGHGIVVDASCLVSLPVDDAGDGIHAQAIEVVAAKPEVRRGLHEASRLSAGVHEVVRAPLGDADRVIRILEERRAVVVG